MTKGNVKYIILFLVCCSVCLINYAQVPSYAWAHSFGTNYGGYDEARSITKDTSGNIYVTGYFNGHIDVDPSPQSKNILSNGGEDLFLAKYDSVGNHLWSFSLGANWNERSTCVVTDRFNNVYIAGTFFGTVDFDPSASTSTLVATSSIDMFFAKYDVNGNFIWAKKIGGGGVESICSMIVSKSDHIYIAGAMSGTTDFDPSAAIANVNGIGGSSDIFFAKYDLNFNYVWAKGIGGISTDLANSISVDSNNVYITGFFNSTCDFDPSVAVSNLNSSGQDIFIARYTINGNYKWAKKVGDSGSDAGTSVIVDRAKNICVAGYFETIPDFDPSASTATLASVGAEDIFFARYDSLGNYIFAKSIGSTGSDRGNSLITDSLNNIYVTGYFSGNADFDPSVMVTTLTATISDVFVARYDQNGNYNWAKSIGSFSGSSNDRSFFITNDSKGSLYFTGGFEGYADFDPSPSTSIFRSWVSTSFFACKIDSSGNYKFAVTSRDGDGGQDIGYSVTTDIAGNVLATGTFSGTIDLDPSLATNTVMSNGFYDMYFSKFDPSGNLLWAYSIGGISNDKAFCIKTDAANNIYLCGAATATVDFDPSPATATLTAFSGYFFIAKYDPNGNYLWALNSGGSGSAEATTIEFDAAGNIYVAGDFNGTVDFDPSFSFANLSATGISNPDIFMAKYDPLGNYLWAKRMGGTQYDYCRSLILDNNSDIIIHGDFEGVADLDPSAAVASFTAFSIYKSLYTAKYDKNGNYLWAAVPTGSYSGYGYDVDKDVSDNLFVTGFYFSIIDFDPLSSAGNYTAASTDGYLVKYDKNGNFLWSGTFSSPNIDNCTALSVNSVGNVLVAGQIQGVVDCDFSALTSTISTKGGSDIFMAQYDNNGNYLWASSMGSASMDFLWDVNEDLAGNIIMCGYFNDVADFDLSAATSTLQSTGDDAFLAKYAGVPLSVGELYKMNNDKSRIYPNPCSTEFRIKGIDANEIVTITDELGRIVKKTNINSLNNYSVTISDLSPGIYFVFGNNLKEKFILLR